MRQKGRLDLDWGNLFAAAVDQFLESALEPDISFGVDAALVSGAEPTVAERGLIRFGVALIARNDSFAAHHDFADCVMGQKPRAIFRHDGYFPASRRSHRSRLSLLGRQR